MEAPGNFKELTQDEGQAHFAKHTRVCSFIEVLAIDIRIFSQIRLDGQYL